VNVPLLGNVAMRRAGSGWITYCPAHEDKNPSLSVSIGKEGRILLKCHAGCSIEQICAAMGITVKDLFPNNGNTNELWRKFVGKKPAPKVYAIKRKPDKYLDKVYRRLISLLDLSSVHREHLLSRGMTQEMIDNGLYRSLPAGRRVFVVNRLVEEFDLSGVPGFGLYNERWAMAMSRSSGILIPVVSPQRKIVACHIRVDNGGRYKNLSSSWLPKGAATGARVHQAIPHIIKRSEIWITEGVLKANIAANVLGAIVWAVPGISNWREVVELWQYLPSRVVIAYDNDKNRKVKSNVRSHAKALAMALSEKSIQTWIAIWLREKGIDDVLLARERVRLKEVSWK